MRSISFAEAINQTLHLALGVDPSVICFGLGVDDPKGIFGTTVGLQEKYGSDRVFDMPTAENGMTGVAIGAALNGMKPVMTHQRLDFFLLALDQLVNGAAKWRYMFGGEGSVPITIRLIIGRGWGQGPTHSQNLHSWFAHVPGLKVVMPTTPADAKGLLMESIFDPDPVVFLEHRWLHNMTGLVEEGDARTPIGKAVSIRQGDAVTLVAFSYMTVEACHAASYLGEQGIHCEVIDMRSLRPIDWETIERSVKATGRLVALDTGNPICSVASEVVAHCAEKLWSFLKAPPLRICLPDVPCPTSPALSQYYYPRFDAIITAVMSMLEIKHKVELMPSFVDVPHDVPGHWFKGPF